MNFNRNRSRDESPIDRSLETERNAYNVAFSELGLEWYWDTDTYTSLREASHPEADRRPCHVRRYLEAHRPHLLQAYDAEFLVNAIEHKRAQVTRAAAN